MKRLRWLWIIAAMAGSPLIANTAALAQTPNPRASGSIFGGATRPADVRQNLEFAATLAEVYDDDMLADLRTTIDPATPRSSGYSTLLLPTANYGWLGRRVQLMGNAASTIRYYPDLEQVRSVTHAASVGMRANLSRHDSLTFNQSAAYAPVYLYRLFPLLDPARPGDLPPGGADYAVNRTESYSYRSLLTFTHAAGRRGRASVSSDFEHTDFRHQDPGRRDVRAYRVGGDYAHGVSRNLQLVGRYDYRHGNFGYGDAGQATEHRADIGLSCARAISASRRATLEARLGAATMELPLTQGVNLPRWRRDLQGEVRAAYDLGRTWAVRAGYTRRAEYVPSLSMPVFADSATARVEGLVTRRLETLVSAAYSSGESAFSRDALTFDTYVGSVRLRYGLTRIAAPFVEYLYYFYDFRGGAQQLPAHVPSRLERNGIRAGLTLWIPLLRR